MKGRSRAYSRKVDAVTEQKRPATPAEQVGPEADQKGRDEE